MEMTCPKCMGTMRQFERSGVVVDQCTECRGIYLDRGELERLIDAENAWHAGQQPAAPPQQPAPQAAPQQPPAPAGHPGYARAERPRWDYDSDEYPMYGHGKGKKKKRRGFLEELFD